MESEKLDAIDLLLLEASRLHLDTEQRAAVGALIAQVSDWDSFTQRALTTHLAPMLFRTLSGWRGEGVPDGTLARLEGSYNKVLMTNIRLYALLSEMLQAWSMAGIEVIPLKGIYLAEKVYGDIGLRHLSDIDLLVRDQDVGRCTEIAIALGWDVRTVLHQSESLDRNFGTAHPVKFLRDGAVIELHVHIHSRGRSYHVDIADYWAMSSDSELHGCNVRQLHTAHLAQHLCIHLYKHLVAVDLKISSFCDVREVLAIGLSAEDWQLLHASGLHYNVWREVQTVLWLGSNYWSMDVPRNLLDDLTDADARKATALFMPFFRAGNIDEATRLQRNWAGNLERLGASEGVGGKMRYLQSYLFPSKDYLRQRYGHGSVMPMLRVYHPVLLLLKGMRGLLLSVFRRSYNE
jgi:hypothetical protein